MDDLIEALTIFRKYGNPEYPTHCEHDELYVVDVPEDLSEEDTKRLDELSFSFNGEFWTSYRFGSA